MEELEEICLNDSEYDCDGCCWECENRTWCWASCTDENSGC